MIQPKDQGRYNKPPQALAPTFRQTQAMSQIRARNHTGNIQKANPPTDPRQRNQQRRAFSAAESRDENEEGDLYDSREHQAFSASRLDGEDREEEDEEDRYAMMGRRDYDLNGPDGSDEGDT